MSSLGVIQQHKHVLQQSTANNNNQVKEYHSNFPSKTFSKDDILLTNPARKKSLKTSTKDMKSNPQILAVARRNARERNRVKQVNNGFANLRERIPNFIAASYESGRGNNKKLSKVETLRMAVEYIRSLEDLLALDDQEVEALSRASYPSPTSSGSPNLSMQKGGYQFSDMSASADEEMSSTSSPPPQYVRINTLTNTYEIIPAQMYEDSENFEPLSAPGHIIADGSMIHPSNLDFKVEDMNLLNGTDSRDSLSPEIYSDQSFSPENIERFQQNKCFVPIFDQFVDNKFILGNIKQENFEESVLTSNSDTFSDVHKGLNSAMQWWDTHTPISGS